MRGGGTSPALIAYNGGGERGEEGTKDGEIRGREK